MKHQNSPLFNKSSPSLKLSSEGCPRENLILNFLRSDDDWFAGSHPSSVSSSPSVNQTLRHTTFSTKFQ